IYFGAPEGVRVTAATVLLPRGPKGLLIPLVIGGLIIFNTMLGSIAERKREIHIYTSLGLAPLHVGVLFLAEAVTYGLMGSIFGYVAGQAVATGLCELGILGDITLNYSGTLAILTMGLVILVVVLSSLVPAYLAGKLAVPSTDMRWSVPRPAVEGTDDVIRDTLPFTVTERTAGGVLAFLYEYLDAHRIGAIGNFSTDELSSLGDWGRVSVSEAAADGRAAAAPDAGGGGGGERMGIEATVWLAPYDLGVRQRVRITIRPTGDPEVLELDLQLTRGSGQVRSWWKLNRVFLADLRRQLLGWRNLRPERMLAYIAEAGSNLAAPVSSDSGA
ncbi:MAG: ABC transporter permease, partial [Planctomycetota bacterium]